MRKPFRTNMPSWKLDSQGPERRLPMALGSWQTQMPRGPKKKDDGDVWRRHAKLGYSPFKPTWLIPAECSWVSISVTGAAEFLARALGAVFVGAAPFGAVCHSSYAKEPQRALKFLLVRIRRTAGVCTQQHSFAPGPLLPSSCSPAPPQLPLHLAIGFGFGLGALATHSWNA